MKKLKITKLSVYIPSEIQEEILKRLPVKPLVQFRSVSKSWKRLIDSPDFIVSYGIRHPHPDRFILRYKLYSHNSVNDRYITLVDNDDDNSFVQQDFIPTIPDLIKKFLPHRIEVVGSSHGLLCFTGCYVYGDSSNRRREEMAVIWNPSLRKSVDKYITLVDKYITLVDKYITLVDNDDDISFVQQDFIPTIPDLIKKFEPHSIEVVGSSHGLLCVKGCYEYCHSSNRDRIEMVIFWNPSLRKSVSIQVPHIYHDLPRCVLGFSLDFGFGVCPATLDPTFLEIKCILLMQDMPGVNLPWKVRVFSLSTGAWSILSTNLPRESVRLRGSQVVIDRFIYWVAYDTNGAGYGPSHSRFLIVSFDLTAKVFKEISLTDSLTNQSCRIQTISKLRESLVLLEYHTEFEEDVSLCCCCLWMMKEQGDSRLFTKLYNINLLPDVTINKILGFRKSGELILETRGETRPAFEFEKCAEVQIYNPNSKSIDNLFIDGVKYLFCMCPYMKTLLLLDQLDGSIYSCFCLIN